MITGLDHIQLAIPAGSEDRVRPFYVDILGMTEVPKPDALQGRGGFWAKTNGVQVHFGVDPAFVAAGKAHPAFVVSDLDTLTEQLAKAGHVVKWDTALPDVKRAFTSDPVGNRIELIAQEQP